MPPVIRGIVIGLLLVGLGSPALLRAQTATLPVSDDATLRRQILQLYPQTLPLMPYPPFNPPTAAKIALGNMLFTDPNLSRCGTVACTSCHDPGHGYASLYQVPPGCDGVRGRRRAPTLYNVGYQSHFFWDGRVQSLEQQALFPIASPGEMANTWDAVLTYLRTGRHAPSGTMHAEQRARYAEHFATAFNGEITPVTVSRALAAYERTILAQNAPFDRWLAGDDEALTPLQKQGAILFFGRANCAVCHPPPLFTDQQFHNIAVPQAGFETPRLFTANAGVRASAIKRGWTVPDDVDLGRQEVPPLQSSTEALGAFKTPTLRNVTLHRPYMHNGAFATLEDVIHHYERLAAGERRPRVGSLAFYVRYRKAFFGVSGGGTAEDRPAMLAFMQALTGNP